MVEMKTHYVRTTKSGPELTLAERLRQPAREERRRAESLKGCSWQGTPPWLPHLDRADNLDLAADFLERAKVKP